jgi:hypothetical protein
MLMKAKLVREGFRIQEPLFKAHSPSECLEWIKEVSYDLVKQGIAKAVGRLSDGSV